MFLTYTNNGFVDKNGNLCTSLHGIYIDGHVVYDQNHQKIGSVSFDGTVIEFQNGFNFYSLSKQQNGPIQTEALTSYKNEYGFYENTLYYKNNYGVSFLSNGFANFFYEDEPIWFDGEYYTWEYDDVTKTIITYRHSVIYDKTTEQAYTYTISNDGMTLINNYDGEYQVDFSLPAHSSFITETIYVCEEIYNEMLIVIHNDGTATYLENNYAYTVKLDLNCVTNNYPWININTGTYLMIYNGIVYAQSVE
jgi:hypothetical protein